MDTKLIMNRRIIPLLNEDSKRRKLIREFCLSLVLRSCFSKQRWQQKPEILISYLRYTLPVSQHRELFWEWNRKRVSELVRVVLSASSGVQLSDNPIAPVWYSDNPSTLKVWVYGLLSVHSLAFKTKSNDVLKSSNVSEFSNTTISSVYIYKLYKYRDIFSINVISSYYSVLILK